MEADLSHAFRNDPWALSMIDSYMNQFYSYSPDEQHRLRWDMDALLVDFESYLERFDDLENEFELERLGEDDE